MQYHLRHYHHKSDHRSIGCGLSHLFPALNFQILHPIRQSHMVAVIHFTPKILPTLLVDLCTKIVHLFQAVIENLIRLFDFGISSVMPQVLRSGVCFQRGIAASELSLCQFPLSLEDSFKELNQLRRGKRGGTETLCAHLPHLCSISSFGHFIVDSQHAMPLNTANTSAAHCRHNSSRNTFAPAHTA